MIFKKLKLKDKKILIQKLIAFAKENGIEISLITAELIILLAFRRYGLRKDVIFWSRWITQSIQSVLPPGAKAFAGRLFLFLRHDIPNIRTGRPL